MSYQVLIVATDSVTGSGLPGASANCAFGNAQGDSNGIISLTITGNVAVGQTVSVTVSAPGHTALVTDFVVTQYTANLNAALTPTVASNTYTLTVTSSGNPVSAASVFLNGNSVGLTATDGTISLTVSAGSNQLQVTSIGYQSYNGGFTTTPPDHVSLTVQTVPAQAFTLISSPPGASVSVNGISGTLDTDGSFDSALQPGTYSLTLSSGSSSSTTDITIVEGTSVYSVPPLSVADSGAGASTQTVSTDSGSAAAPTSSNPGTVVTANSAQSTSDLASQNASSVSPSSDVPDFEFVNAQAGFGRYFTATQARMYVGNLFIEELAGCQFVLQSNRVPIFGYASRKFDAVGEGKGLVQGQIMINFISEGYLYTVLNQVKQLNSNGTGSTQEAFKQLMQQAQLLQASNTSDPAVQKQIAALQAQRQQMLAADPTLASAYKRTTLSNSTTSIGPNAVYQGIPFDIDIELEGGGRTVKRKLINCVLTSNEQIYPDSDSPLIDSYGFIAREMR